MDKLFTSDQIGALVRNLFMPLIAYLIAKGLIPAEGWDAFLAGAVTFITFAWGWWVKRDPDTLMTKEQLLAMIRNLSAPLAAFAIGKGWLTSESVEWIVAGASSIFFAIWSIWSKQTAPRALLDERL